jgi:hypothetical protein
MHYEERDEPGNYQKERHIHLIHNRGTNAFAIVCDGD